MARSEKNSFILYKDSIGVISRLSDEQAGRLLKAIFQYQNDQDLPEMDQVTEIAFTMIRTYFDRDLLKYQETCQRRAESGKLGGRPKAKKPNGYFENQMKPKKPESESESVIESESESEKKKNTPKKHKHGAFNNVLLTDQELEKLQRDFPNWKELIEIFSEGLEMKGYTYKSHYLAIRSWARNDKRGNQRGVSRYGNNPEQSRGYTEDFF